jgi:hypothetical protein
LWFGDQFEPTWGEEALAIGLKELGYSMGFRQLTAQTVRLIRQCWEERCSQRPDGSDRRVFAHEPETEASLPYLSWWDATLTFWEEQVLKRKGQPLTKEADMEFLKYFNDVLALQAVQEAFEANEPNGRNIRYRIEGIC